MSYLAALQDELAGYERYGKTDRADQVRAEIARVTGAAEQRKAAGPAKAPHERRAPRKSTG